MNNKCIDVKTCKDPLFVGLDPSINGTGLVIIDENANIVEQKLFSIKSETFEESLVKYEKEIELRANMITLQDFLLLQHLDIPKQVFAKLIFLHGQK